MVVHQTESKGEFLKPLPSRNSTVPCPHCGKYLPSVMFAPKPGINWTIPITVGIVLTAIIFILFWEEPDIRGAIVHWLMRSH